MYICFVCNAETEAMKEGLFQGNANGEKNIATRDGLKKVRETAEYLVEIIDDVKKSKPIKSAKNFGKRAKDVEVYLYSGDQFVCAQTSMVLAEVLKKNGLLRNENMFMCGHLNGRNYGEIEGIPESQIKTLKYAVKKPRHTISYLRAEAGLDNSAGIESTNMYAGGVFRFLFSVFKEYDSNDNAVVVVSSTPDFFKAMKTHRDLRHLCYSGQNPKECSIAECDEIHPGELRFVEVNMLKALPRNESWVWDDEFFRFETRKFPQELLDLIDAKLNKSSALGE